MSACERDDAVVRRILNHVEGHVVEVALVADAEAAADAGLAIADRVIGKSDLGSELLQVQVPEAAVGSIRRG